MKHLLAAKLALVAVSMVLALIAAAFIPVPNRQESRASVSLVIEKPQAEIWAVISDLSQASNYVPGVERVEILSAERAGVDATRRVYRSESDWLDETVTHWQPERGFVLRLHQQEAAPFPFASASFEYDLQSLSPAATGVHLSLIYRPRYGLLGQLLDSLVLTARVEEQVLGVANGLRQLLQGKE